MYIKFKRLTVLEYLFQVLPSNNLFPTIKILIVTYSMIGVPVLYTGALEMSCQKRANQVTDFHHMVIILAQNFQAHLGPGCTSFL